MTLSIFRATLLVLGLAALSACSGQNASTQAPAEYDAVVDGEITLPAVPAEYLEAPNRRAQTAYNGTEDPGTIVVDPHAKFLYFVEEDGMATRYPIAVGIEGKGFRGTADVNHTKEWPSWAPTKNMLRTEPEIYGPFAAGIPGGVASPLGARALYLYRGGKDTRFRIHGTNDMASIGNANTAGCIRLFNQDIIHLADRTPSGTRVVVRTYEQSVELEGEELANRGEVIPPKIVDPDVIYAAVEAEEAKKAE